MLPTIHLLCHSKKNIAFDSMLKFLNVVGKFPELSQRLMCASECTAAKGETSHRHTLQLENLFLDNVSDREKQTFATRVNWGSSGSNYFISHLVSGIYWANNLLYEGCRALWKWSGNNDY